MTRGKGKGGGGRGHQRPKKGGKRSGGGDQHASDAESEASDSGMTATTEGSVITGMTSSSSDWKVKNRATRQKKVQQRGAEDLDVSENSPLGEIVDELIDCKAGKALRHIQKLKELYNKRPQCDEIDTHIETIVEVLLKSITRGTTEEVMVACDCLNATVLSLGEGNISPSLYDRMVECLRSAAKFSSSSIARGAAATAYGIVASVGCDDDLKLAEAEYWFIEQSRNAKWSGVYSKRPRGRALSVFDQQVDVEGADSSHEFEEQDTDGLALQAAIREGRKAAATRDAKDDKPQTSQLSRIETLAGEADGLLNGWLLLASDWRVSKLATYDVSPSADLWYFASQCVLYVPYTSVANPHFASLRLTAGTALGMILEALWKVRGDIERVDYHPLRAMKMKFAVASAAGKSFETDEDDDSFNGSTEVISDHGATVEHKGGNREGVSASEAEFESPPDGDFRVEAEPCAAFEVKRGQTAVVDRLRYLATKPQRGMSKADQRELYTAFRDVLKTAESGESPELVFCVGGKDRRMTLRGWSATFRYKVLRAVFRGSLSQHFEIDSPALFLLTSTHGVSNSMSPDHPRWNSMVGQEYNCDDRSRRKNAKFREMGRNSQRAQKVSMQSWNCDED